MPEPPTLALEIRPDDLTGSAIRELITEHLRGMREVSPPSSVHALDLDALRAPGLTFWSAWAGGELAGMGALKRLDDQRGEIKSMRVAASFLGRGVGRAMLHHLVAHAKATGLGSLWLETGSTPAFAAALGLYAREGFTRCGPFGDYVPDPFSVFMTRTL